jgi:hypothetical protein
MDDVISSVFPKIVLCTFDDDDEVTIVVVVVVASSTVGAIDPVVGDVAKDVTHVITAVVSIRVE